MRKLVVVLTGATALLVGLLTSVASAQTTTPTTCPGYPICVGGITVGHAGQIQVSAASSGSLAFTGSNQTLTYVLIALGLLAVGLVLVVATRRRAHILNRG
jgi:LPXTG-motif cell wall-anchored protein